MGSETAGDVEKALLRWANYQLGKIDLKAQNIVDDFEDGFFLIMLIDITTGESIKDYHSRLFADRPIENASLIKENQKQVISWVVQKWQVSAEESSALSDEPFQNMIQPVIWHLIAKTVNHNGRFGRKSQARYEEAKRIFKESKVPFLFEDLDAEEKGSIVLIHSCIFLDRLKRASEGPKARQLKKWAPAPQRYVTPKPLEMVIFDERVIRVFLSSTFRDMQYERDEFFKNGAVELKKQAKSLGFELVFIDLRWGLTSKDSNEGWVVIRCLDSIEKCPYFVCSLGARYGWIPDQNKTELNMNERLEELKKTKPDAKISDIWIEWRTETNKRFPFINSMPGLSVTEYEIQFAALIDKPACSRAFFYFRDEDYAVSRALNEAERKLFQSESEEARKSQNELKEKVKAKFGHVVYQGPKEYSDFVTFHLIYSLRKDFSNIMVRDPEDQAHHQFKMHRLAGFGGRKELLETIRRMALDQLDSNEAKITVLAAKSGIGKSSLMAAAARDLENMKIPELSVLFHFVGSTNLSNYVESISIRFWTSVLGVFGGAHKNMDESGYSKEGIQGLLDIIQQKNGSQKFIFLIDAINQIHPSQETPVPHLLGWLPKKAPKNVSLVVSTIDTHVSCKIAKESGLEAIPVSKLTVDEVKESTESFLHRYDKTLSEIQMNMILYDCEDTGHPLYLRIVLDEIRVFGVYEKLDQELNSLLSTNGVIELYTFIVKRWQDKFNKEGALIVDVSMKTLFVTRIGLSEANIDMYMEDMIKTKFVHAEWKSFFFTLIESLFVRNGRYMYFHQLLVETVQEYFFTEKKALIETKKQLGEWLFSEYSSDTTIDEELAAEICYQLLGGESFDKLVEYLKQEHIVILMLEGRYRYEFVNCWRVIHEKGIASYKDIYAPFIKSTNKVGDILVKFFLEMYENSFLLSVVTQRISKRPTEESKFDDYLALGCAYKNMQNWEESKSYLKECLNINQIHKQENDELISSLHEELGSIYLKEMKLEESLKEFNTSFELRLKKYGEHDVSVAQSHDRFGDIFLLENNVENALREYKVAMEIRSKKVGNDHPLISASLQNLGHVSFAQKKYDEAISHYEAAKRILDKFFGDKHPSVATVLGCLAKVYVETGKNSEALVCLYESVETFIANFGENHPNVVDSYEMIGDINHEMKEYRKALAAYTATLEARKRTLGKQHPDYAKSLENVARTNFELGSNAQTIEYMQAAFQIRKHTGTKTSLKDSRQCIGMAKMFVEKEEHELIIDLHKHLIQLFEKTYAYDFVGIWDACDKIGESYERKDLHHEAITFWVKMKESATQKLGWTHARTLYCCKYISFHEKLIGTNKEPIEYTRYRELITENIPESKEDDNWSREKIVSRLFDILYLSKTDEKKSAAASNAITLLRFMNVPLSGLDLSRVRIPNANLSNAILEGTNFTGATLDGVNFTNSMLNNCIFERAVMNNVKFGFPYTSLDEQKDRVNCVCKSTGPNGEIWLASASNDNTVRVWDLATATEVMKLEGHSDTVFGVCAVKGPNNEAWIASVSQDQLIIIWDLATGNQVNTLKGHNDWIRTVAPAEGPKGEHWLVSGGKDKTVCIWDFVTGKQLKSLKGHTNQVSSVCSVVGINGEKLVASGSFDKTVRIWDLATGNQVKLLKGHTNDVWSVCSIEGPNKEKWLASSSDDKTIRIWDVATGNQVRVMEGHTNGISCIHGFDGPNGEKWLASASDDKTVRIWDFATGNEVKVLEGHSDIVLSVCTVAGPNGEIWLASGGWDNSVRIWDYTQVNLIEKHEGHGDQAVWALCNFQGTNGKKLLASGSVDEYVRIWDLETGNEVSTLDSHTDTILSICEIQGSNGEKWLATGGDDKTIRIWDKETWSEVRTMETYTHTPCVICEAQGSNGEKWMISAGSEKTIHIWDLITFTEVDCLEGHSNSVFDICVLKGPKGENWMASGGIDCNICLWDLSTKTVIQTLEGHSDCIKCICGVSGPNKEIWLASAGSDSTICIWDLETGSRIKVLEGHTDAVGCIYAFQGPNGECWLASGSEDKTVRIWDLESGSQINIIHGHTDSVNSVRGVQGLHGKTCLASGGGDGAVRIWDLSNTKKKDKPKDTESHIQSPEGNTLEEENGARMNGSNTICIFGVQSLEGAHIGMQDIQGLSHFNKRLLYSLGALSKDKNFVQYCEEGKYTSYQAELVSQCYENGWGVDANQEKALEWKEKAREAKVEEDGEGKRKDAEEDDGENGEEGEDGEHDGEGEEGEDGEHDGEGEEGEDGEHDGEGEEDEGEEDDEQ